MIFSINCFIQTLTPPPQPSPPTSTQKKNPLINKSKLQETLLALGYDPGSIDGIPCDQTATAVSAFQSDHDLAVDGIVGAITNNALLELNQRICLHLPAPRPDELDLTDFDPDDFNQ